MSISIEQGDELETIEVTPGVLLTINNTLARLIAEYSSLADIKEQTGVIYNTRNIYSLSFSDFGQGVSLIKSENITDLVNGITEESLIEEFHAQNKEVAQKLREIAWTIYEEKWVK